jgi:hypothetical protein
MKKALKESKQIYNAHDVLQSCEIVQVRRKKSGTKFIS